MYLKIQVCNLKFLQIVLLWIKLNCQSTVHFTAVSSFKLPATVQKYDNMQ